MKQGTISVLVGCHSPVHSVLVIISWKKLFGHWPKPWQIVCIFLHDIGHWGLNYLDDPEQKAHHWRLGTRWAGRLFGWAGACLVGGHCSRSPHKRSELYKPDKYSWYIAPRWWLWLNCITEPKLTRGHKRGEAIKRFQEQVRQSIESGEYGSTHQMYLERWNAKPTNARGKKGDPK